MDDLERSIAIEVGIVHKLANRGQDVTVNATNVIMSLSQDHTARQVLMGRIEENQRRLNKIIAWKNVPLFQ